MFINRLFLLTFIAIVSSSVLFSQQLIPNPVVPNPVVPNQVVPNPVVPNPVVPARVVPPSAPLIEDKPEERKPKEPGIKLTYVPRNQVKTGNLKVVTVPAMNPRQAKIDAQNYHTGWVALDAWEGQSRVMYEVLIKKLPPYVPGSPSRIFPITK